MSRYLSSVTSTTHEHEQPMVRGDRARKVVLAKGVFDILLALGIMFLPIAVYDGPVPALVSKMTGLQFIYRDADPGGAYALASVVMGCGVAALAAGMSKQDDAYKIIATLCGSFAYTALLGCLFSPKKFGSSVLLLAALQDVAWFFGILAAGNYTIGDTIGLRSAFEKMQKKKHELEERQHAREREKEHGERETERDPTREKLTERHSEHGSGRSGGYGGGQEKTYGS